jgi:recombinational DNA repair protein (RecF pathway)
MKHEGGKSPPAPEFATMKSMQEYVTDAIVLTKRPVGELDGRYALFTKKFGKMTGRATSSRKITSKLCGHLEPGSAVKVRFIEQKGTRIVDALKTARVAIGVRDLAALADLLPEMDPDAPLWEHLSLVRDGGAEGGIGGERFSWATVLKLLGWDPEGAACAGCGTETRNMRQETRDRRQETGNGQLPLYFQTSTQEFFCANCAPRAHQRGSLLLVSCLLSPAPCLFNHARL